MLLLWLMLPCAGVLALAYLIGSASIARQQRAVQEKCRLADFHARHESIPINEERRERELRQLRAMWALS